MTYVGCIGGAVLIEDYVQQLKDAGFSDIVVVDTGADLNAYTEIGTERPTKCCALCLTTHTHSLTHTHTHTHTTHTHHTTPHATLTRAELLCARG
jgi:hypothetical protein